MLVIDHEPQFWFLFELDERLLFDINCESSFVGYEFMMFLNDEETKQYKLAGHSYLNELAEKINYSAPIMRESRSPYKSRYVANQYSEKAVEAIKRWEATNA